MDYSIHKSFRDVNINVYFISNVIGERAQSLSLATDWYVLNKVSIG